MTTSSRPWIIRALSYRPAISVGFLTLLGSLFFVLFSNGRLWRVVTDVYPLNNFHSWWVVGMIGIALTAIHVVVLSLLCNRWTVKPILSLVVLVTAFAVFYMEKYGVIYDKDMIRSVLYTQTKEAQELITRQMVLYVALFGVLPVFLIWRVRLRQTSWGRAFLMRTGFIVMAAAIAVGATLSIFQDASALVRNHKEVRHLLMPANYMVSLGKVIFSDTATAATALVPEGTDAKLAANVGSNHKPVLLVLVIGETARAANWGLNGYERQTTPELAKLDVLNFNKATSCGTNTEASVPCMFSFFGRRNYDEQGIRQHESLLHVLDHAGVKTLWRDNQTGCKGVCAGLPMVQVDDVKDPALCNDHSCLDGILLKNLDQEIQKTPGNLVVVLHQLGNHGPSYFLRYSPEFRQFTPTCDTQELGHCSHDQIVNSYDNALLYTDHFLAQTIALLKAQKDHDTVMFYMSDHGESLGENGLFLHGLPYVLAPKEQKQIPMVLWMSPAYTADHGVLMDCMKQRAAEPASHDNMVHTVLGLMGVQTKAYDASMDLTATCRK